MKNRIGLIMLFIFAAAIMFVVSPSEADAGEKVSVKAEWTNPVYEGLIDSSCYGDALAESDKMNRQGNSAVVYHKSVGAVAADVREQLKNRKTEFVVYYGGSSIDQNLLVDILQTACQHTGNSTEGDYIKHHMVRYSAVAGGYSGRIAISFSVAYLSTAQQEKDLNDEVSALLSEMNLSDKTDYEKIRAIYDYICSNIKYDYVNLNDSSYIRKFTAYAALHDKTAVCQGYANLFYRLALEAGVDSRIITGIAGGGAHAWNIAEVNNCYYYLDSTWDAGKTSYKYFLMGSTDFAGHENNAEFSDKAFLNAYYIPQTKYDAGVPKSECGLNAPEKVSTNLTAYYGSAAGYNDIKVTWSEVDGADGYYVRYKPAGASAWKWSEAAEQNYIYLKDLDDGVRYNIRVYPYVKDNGVNCKSVYYKDVLSVYTLQKVTAPSVSKVSSGYVKVKWKGISGETGYQVYRAGSMNGKYTKVKTVGMASSSYPYAKIKTAKRTYYYKVRAYKSLGGGKYVYGPFSAVKAYKLK